MLLLASDAWVGVVGVAIGAVLGGVLGFLTSWLVHRSERAERIAERSRAERRDAYAALLTHAEDSVHFFQWLSDGEVSPAGIDADKHAADVFYDHEVTPRYRVLKILGPREVVEAAREMRNALNAVRHFILDDASTLPTAGEERGEFETKHNRYRAARNTFTDAARADLGQDAQRSEPTLQATRHKT